MDTVRLWLQRRLRGVASAVAGGIGLQDSLMLGGISVRLWRMYGFFWLVCLGYAGAVALTFPIAPVRVLLVLGSLGIFIAIYSWFIWPHPDVTGARSRSQLRQASGWFALLVALVLALSLFDSPSWLWLFVCVAAIAGLIFPLRAAAVIIVLLTLGCLILGIVRLGWVQAIPLALLVRGLGIDMVGLILLMGLVRQLHRQQRALAQMAATEERLRVARDLHDLLGQTLSVITLKSALAGRLVTADPPRAAREIQEVEQVARMTLREVRAAIAGYRQLSLRNELQGAQQILQAADIVVTLPQDSVSVDGAMALPPAVDTALAWVVREGVTNVLRHSEATHCQIALTYAPESVQMEISNDGCRQPGKAGAPGNGIAGLMERVRALGGQLVVEPRPNEQTTGFRLWVAIPLRGQITNAGEAER